MACTNENWPSVNAYVDVSDSVCTRELDCCHDCGDGGRAGVEAWRLQGEE